jgi:hypothetical protein
VDCGLGRAAKCLLTTYFLFYSFVAVTFATISAKTGLMHEPTGVSRQRIGARPCVCKGRINAVQLGRLDVPFAVFVLGP